MTAQGAGSGGLCDLGWVPDFRSVEKNLRAAMRLFSLVSPAGEVRDLPGVTIVSTGLNHAMFNSAMLTAPAPDGHGDLDRRLMIAKVHFDARGLRWSFWLCEDLLEPAARRRAGTVCEARGLRLVARLPGMYAERLLPARRPLPELEFRPIADEQTRLAFCSITSEAFSLPLAASREIYGSERLWREGYTGFVGYDRGEPVTTAALLADGGVAGIYSVATPREHRGRGCAEAVVRYAVEFAQRTAGAGPSVLQTSPIAQPLYERMGYRVVTGFSVYS